MMNIFSSTVFALIFASALPSTLLAAAPLKKYIWSDAQGFKPLDPTCRLVREDIVSMQISQNPAAKLDSYTVFMSTDSRGKTSTKHLLDRSLTMTYRITADRSLSAVKVLSVPHNAHRPRGFYKTTNPGDIGAVKTNYLQEIGNFVIEVLDAKGAAQAAPFQVKESYWQAVLEQEKYVTYSCGVLAKPTNYIFFDVYDSKAVFPVAQVGVSLENAKIFEKIRVLTPDEANKETIGEIQEVQQAQRKNGHASGGSSTSESDDRSPEDYTDEDDTEEPDQTLPRLGYVICSVEKTIPVFDKNMRQIGTAERFEEVIPFQSWDEKKKSSHIEVQFSQRKDRPTGLVSRNVVTLKSYCGGYKKDPIKDKDDGIDYTKIPLDSSVSKTDCCKFPTRSRPTVSYALGKTRFRAARSGGKRLHAGTDLYRRKGDDAVAVASGTIIRGHYFFYQGVFAIEVKHHKFIGRYGEILGSSPKGIAKGKNVVAGQTLGYIGKVNSGCCSPMLHFELYSGTASGPLTRYRSPPYDRRPDVMDPTSLLRQWERKQFGHAY